MNKPEILAPAGSVTSLHAAVNAGADAVYLGGSRYGARAFADNFSEDELKEGILYAHLYGVKVYMTVNTLFRNEEIRDLYEYILPYYKAGLDAVIVQDLGVLKYIHHYFPDLDIHASTQMAITTPYAYELLKDYGVTRIVPARELSINEIRELKDPQYSNDGLEVEIFVQGALCVCYSGMCLMSSFIGGRSGNRGRCAGSCRLPYYLYDNKGNKIHTEGHYLLSQKDLCSVKSIPDLVDAGVDSFKIEGRMKKPEYVASCVRSYRKLVDYCCSENYSKTEYEKLALSCRDEMTEIFNRGGFTDGYFYKNNGKDMMSFNAPGHMGVVIGNITSVNKHSIKVKLNKDLHRGDILVITIDDEEITLTSNVDACSGKEVELNVSQSGKIRKGMKLCRKYNALLSGELSKYYYEDKKLIISGKVTLHIGEESLLEVSCISGDNAYKVIVNGDTVEKASTKPIDKDSIISKICQTGDSCFQFSDIDVVMDDDIFYSIKSLKDLRRKALFELKEKIINSLRREVYNEIDIDADIKEIIHKSNNISQNNPLVRVMVSSMEQLHTVIDYSEEIKIAIDLQYFSKSDIITLMNDHPEYSYALPMILRPGSISELKLLPLDKCQSLILRNIDELSYLQKIGYSGEIIADYSLYSMNDMAADFIRMQHENTVITIPVELNKKQLESLSFYNDGSELIVYGYQPLMITASCFQENTGGCNKGSDNSFIMKDRKNQNFYIRSICKYCYNIIYNGVPTVLYDKMSKVADLHTCVQNRIFCGAQCPVDIGSAPTVVERRCPHGDDGRRDKININNYSGIVRFQFVNENGKQIVDILDSFFEQAGYPDEYTRGHYTRGV